MTTKLYPLRDPIENIQRQGIDRDIFALRIELDGDGHGLITLPITSYIRLMPLLIGREPVGELDEDSGRVSWHGYYTKGAVIADDGRILSTKELE